MPSNDKPLLNEYVKDIISKTVLLNPFYINLRRFYLISIQMIVSKVLYIFFLIGEPKDSNMILRKLWARKKPSPRWDLHPRHSLI